MRGSSICFCPGVFALLAPELEHGLFDGVGGHVVLVHLQGWVLFAQKIRAHTGVDRRSCDGNDFDRHSASCLCLLIELF